LLVLLLLLQQLCSHVAARARTILDDLDRTNCHVEDTLIVDCELQCAAANVGARSIVAAKLKAPEKKYGVDNCRGNLL
jgi:hypothetical protein